MMSITLLFEPGMLGQQQQTKTWIDNDGVKQVLDSVNGYTATGKNGKLIEHQSPAEVTTSCDLNKASTIFVLRDNVGMKVFCDEWGELHPNVKIERVPFAELILRLVSFTSPSTSFARYRGMELSSGTESKTYDATILPNDIGNDASCTIKEENRHEEGMIYTYECSIKTPSFLAALQLKDRLVQALSNLHLSEDEIREHGLATTARQDGMCAPSGECLEEHTYVTTRADWKFVQIDANPILERNALAEIRAMKTGTHAPFIDIATDAGDLSFEVFSVGPRKTDVANRATR